jgi:mediator of RNA polymerase II transcription subunit 18
MAQPVSTAIDSLTAALRSNIIPNQEYLLQGSILDSSVEVLLHRLRGLCDNVDAALETFHDHEMCFSISMYKALLNFPTYIHTLCIVQHGFNRFNT